MLKPITLSTGKTIEANGDIIGIDADGVILHGYDGVVCRQQEYYDYLGETAPLTHAERAELAEIMISRWKHYREQQGGFSLAPPSARTPTDYERPTWENAGRVHDWRNYISDEVRAIWGSFSQTQRAALARNAEAIANEEEWD